MSERGGHHLETFIRQTFGEQVGAILLAGYGGEAGCHETTVGVTGLSGGGGEHEWLIEVSGDLPYGDEPLVLAALLKLLLTRGPLNATLDFTFKEVLAELGWSDRRFAQDAVDTAVRKYVGLSYVRRGKGEGSEAQGVYALVTGYDQLTGSSGGRVRILNRVHFHPRFIEGLREFRIEFTGIAFGELRP